MAGPWEAFQTQAPAAPSALAPAPNAAAPSQGFDPSAYAPPAATPAPAQQQSGPWSQFSGSTAPPHPLDAYPPAPVSQAPASSGWGAVAPYPAPDGNGMTTIPPEQYAAWKAGQQPPPAQPTTILGKVGQAVDQFGRSIAQGATFGFGDELAAGADAATHAVLGRGSDADTFSQRYDANLAAERNKDANIPWEISVPGQIAGGVATIATGAPAAIAKGAGTVVRLIPGGANALSALSAGGEAVANTLSRIPGASIIAPAVPIAAEGAAYGAAQGFGDGEGGLDNRLQSAGLGAATGAVIAPAVAGAGNLIGRGVRAVGNTLSEAGFGAKAPILDATGKPIVGSDGQTVAATPGVARVAGRQIADTTSDLPAAQAALAQPNQALLPGDQPTTFQVTGDYGQGQKELELRNTPGTGNTPGPSAAFLKRAADQNAMRVNTIATSVPADASSADLVNSLSQQQADLTARHAGAVAQAQQGTLQSLGGLADSTPTQAGAGLRSAIDQARAPGLQQADAAVQMGQTQAAGAAEALGGAPPAGADAATAAQRFGQQFRSMLDSNAQNSKTAVSRLYDAVDPDGTLAVNMQPAREAAQTIIAQMPQNAAPLAGEEAAIFGTMANLPDAQSFRELGALNSRVTTAMRAARTDPAQAQSYARLSQLRSGLANIMQDSVEGQAGQDAAAVRAGTMAPEDSMLARMRAHLEAQKQDYIARQNTPVSQAGSGAAGDIGGPADPLAPGVYPGGGSQGQARGRSANPSGNPSLQGQPPLIANADQGAVDRIAAANTAYAEHKSTFGARAPGVGPVLAPGPTQGTFKMADSAVPSAIFSRGPGAAERVQAAVRAGLTPDQIANYAAFDLRRAATNPDGTLNPTAFAKWRQQNSEAFKAITRADPSIAGRFDTAQQASQRLVDLQTQRAALDATHPLKPGWGDAEVMQRVWQGGPRGADSVRSATSAAGGSPVAASSIADYAAYSLRKAAAPDGVLDPRKYAQWVKTYDGALSARPDIKAQFDTAADAQRTLNKAAEDHAVALRTYQNSVARHFLGGADPADRIGQILNSATRQRDMAELARLTENDPAARAGIQRAVVDHIFSRLQGNAVAGQTGIEKLKSDAFQTFVNRAGPALHDVMSPQQVDTLRRVALTLQRDNLSVDGTRVAGGSDTAQKESLMVAGKPGSTLLNMVKAHGITGLLTIIGAKMGPVGAFVGNKAGAGLTALKAAGISQTNDLVKEAMLHPALARVLLEQLTPSTEGATASRAMHIITNLSATRSAHAAVAVQRAANPQSRQPPVRVNALSQLRAAMAPKTQNALAGAER